MLRSKPFIHCDLNVAGSRESKASGIQDMVKVVMVMQAWGKVTAGGDQ